MKISYTYSYSDYKALNRAYSNHTNKYLNHAVSIIYWIHIGVCLPFVYQILFLGEVITPVIAVMFTVGVILILAVCIVFPLYVRSTYKRFMIDGVEHKFIFSNDLITINMPSTNIEHLWSAILRVDEEPKHFFLWINKIQAYAVPKRGFSSTDDIENFKTLVAEKVPGQEVIK